MIWIERFSSIEIDLRVRPSIPTESEPLQRIIRDVILQLDARDDTAVPRISVPITYEVLTVAVILLG